MDKARPRPLPTPEKRPARWQTWSRRRRRRDTLSGRVELSETFNVQPRSGSWRAFTCLLHAYCDHEPTQRSLSSLGMCLASNSMSPFVANLVGNFVGGGMVRQSFRQSFRQRSPAAYETLNKYQRGEVRGEG